MRRRHGCLHSLLVLLLTALAVAGFWYFENNVVSSETYTVSSADLPAGLDGLRVAELADLHGKTFGAGSEALLEAVRSAKPDLIALDGDIADEHTADVSALAPLFRGLAAIAPTYYVTGNHEWVMTDLPGFLQLLEKCGVTVLRNEYITLSKGGGTIALAGVDDPNGPYDKKTAAQLTAEIRAALGDSCYILMLAHRNDELADWASLGVQTVLTGHGHGGIVRLPFLGGLLGVDRSFFPKYTAGTFTEGATTMVVSRGLGVSGVNFRLFNRPDLPVIVLRRSASGG